MQQGSQRERDEVVWNTVAIKIGTSGMDLRQPAAPDTLADLINARFVSELHVGRRSGHRSVQIIDDDTYPALMSLATYLFVPWLNNDRNYERTVIIGLTAMIAIIATLRAARRKR